jgi:hypothetical protein
MIAYYLNVPRALHPSHSRGGHGARLPDRHPTQSLVRHLVWSWALEPVKPAANWSDSERTVGSCELQLLEKVRIGPSQEDVNRESVSVKTKQAEVDQFQDKKHKQSKQKTVSIRTKKAANSQNETRKAEIGQSRIRSTDQPAEGRIGSGNTGQVCILKPGIQFIAVVVSPALHCHKRSQN